jgi:FkbM family methyltransferase
MQILRLFPGVAHALRRATGRILHKAEMEIATETVGSDYGAHTLPHDSLNSKSIVYSFGIGTDVTFDLGVIERYGCKVNGFDPTPSCRAWVAQQSFPAQFVFHPFGLGEVDSLIGFQSPGQAGHVSFSRARNGAMELALPVKRLSTIMSELGDTEIDVLKLDIEGFEYAVLPDMLQSAIYPKILAVEFHHKMYGYEDAATLSAVDSLRDAGFKLFFVSNTGREYSFIYNP